MIKKGTIYIIIAILTVGLILLLEYNKPKKINWFPSYTSHHKIPYGTYVLNDLIKEMFNNKVKQVHLPPYEFLLQNDNIKGTYFFTNDNITHGEAELNSLLDWTSKGNTLFIASENLDEQLLDTLHLETSNLYDASELQPTFIYQLVHPKLQLETPVSFAKDHSTGYFNVVDTLNTTALGWVKTVSDSSLVKKEAINIVKQSFGKGTIVLSTFPKAFTNYFILNNENRKLTAGLLSYIDDTETIIMDNHYKSGKSFYTSPMHIFLNTREFRWAYYISLIGVLLYVVFEGKRKQRSIPLVTPLKNQTLAFTRTIANMYFEKGEQTPIVKHKIAYFLDYVRSKFYMGTHNQNKEFYQNLGARSNHTAAEIEKLFKSMQSLENKALVSDKELIELNKKIEAFKAKANGK
ncbi:MAG: hypothetical protein COA50_14330 [Flavobacteriaceae bacterium]|nr:MAG: hypothetical protein COA50_14330 [Flavobacteriaceae bacterium]